MVESNASPLLGFLTDKERFVHHPDQFCPLTEFKQAFRDHSKQNITSFKATLKSLWKAHFGKEVIIEKFSGKWTRPRTSVFREFNESDTMTLTNKLVIRGINFADAPCCVTHCGMRGRSLGSANVRQCNLLCLGAFVL